MTFFPNNMKPTHILRQKILLERKVARVEARKLVYRITSPEPIHSLLCFTTIDIIILM